MKIAYKHIVNRINSNPPLDEISEKLFQLGHEHDVENQIFDIEVTPNRGDCLSLLGILRELSAFYEIDLDQECYEDKIENLSLNFKNNAVSDCPEIFFLKIDIDEPPNLYNEELHDYFFDLDLPYINFFTDISNFISYETGQPTHCYDFEKIGNDFSLDIIEYNTKFKTLNNKEIDLAGRNIAFTKGKEIINLAGVMGGELTACSKNTKSVLVECAYFNPESIIGSSVKYGLNSDAAYKFERGVNPTSQEKVLRRFIHIVSKHSLIKDVSIYNNSDKEFVFTKIPVDVSKINKILGTDINYKDYSKFLCKLGFVIKDNFITVPSYRSDVKSQNDLAEEIARLIGFDNIPIKKIKHSDKRNKHLNAQKIIKNFLIDHGFFEVINNPFVPDEVDGSIKVDNPLDINRSHLRRSLKNSLVQNLLYNERRQNDSIKFFEISDVYSMDDSLKKKNVLGVIASGRVGKNHINFNKKIDINYLSEIFQNITNSNLKFELLSRDNLNTKIQNEIVYLEVEIDSIENDLFQYNSKNTLPQSYIKYKPISEFPKVYRDISFSVNKHGDIHHLNNLIFSYDNNNLNEVFIFDYFNNTKLDITKIGFRFIFQSSERTLIDKDVNDIIDDIISRSKSLEGIDVPGA